jgi:glycine/D-amino acid oxidase-like deaminating enzyme
LSSERDLDVVQLAVPPATSVRSSRLAQPSRIRLDETTPDHNAIIGEAGVSRFLYAMGFCGHGFQQRPAVGEILRDMCLRRPAFVDVAPLASSASTSPRCVRNAASCRQ